MILDQNFKSDFRKACSLSIILLLTSAQLQAQWNMAGHAFDPPVRGLFFVNADIGYAVGDSGSIAKTIDGGAEWSPQLSGVSNTLNDVYFTNKDTGFACGDNGILLTTTDGGTWVTSSSNLPFETLYTIDFVNDSTGWVGAMYGDIYKTIDGGNSWVSETLSVTSPVTQVDFIDEQLGYATSGTQVFRSTDSGETWQPVAGNDENLYALAFASNNFVAVGGTHKTIIYTTTGWANQNTLTSSPNSNAVFRSGTAPSDSIIYLADDAGDIFSTVNAGATWDSITLPGFIEISAMHFPNPFTGYLGTNTGDIFKLSLPCNTSPVITYSCDLVSNFQAGNQWYRNGDLLSGATSNTYTPTEPGNYAVVVTGQDCSATSNTIIVNIVISSDFNPEIGDQHFYSFAEPENVAPGDTGRNANWNFANVFPLDSELLEMYLDTAGIPYSKEFPEANICLQSGNGFAYYKTDDLSWSVAGYASPDYTAVYTDPLVLLNYPLQYGCTGYDTVSTQFSNGGAEFHRHGSRAYIVDGEGTVVTPFMSALAVRLNSTEYYLDSVFISEEFLQTFITTIQTYWWISPDVEAPLFKINELNFDNGDSVITNRQVLYLAAPVGINDPVLAENNWQAYFDHNGSLLRLALNDGWSHSPLSLQLYNIAGQPILPPINIQSPGRQITISLPPLAKGVYCVAVNQNHIFSSKKILLY